jgi:hypothetical protein
MKVLQSIKNKIRTDEIQNQDIMVNLKELKDMLTKLRRNWYGFVFCVERKCISLME